MQTQEINFRVRLPIAAKDLADAERFARLEAIIDVKKSSTDSARVTYYEHTPTSEEISVSYHLKSFLQKPIQELTYYSQVHVSANEKTFLGDNTLIGSYSLPGFTGLTVFVKREVFETALPADNEVNVVAESIPIFDFIRDKIELKLQKILGVPDLLSWEAAYTGPKCTLHFSYVVNSTYDQANFYVLQAAQYSIRCYLIYFYKSLILFASKLGNPEMSKQIIGKLRGLNAVREKAGPKNSPNDYLSLQPIADFNLLKSRTNVQAGYSTLQEMYTRTVVVSPQTPKRLKEGAVLKRGEGPFDFNWNERYLILDTGTLAYYRIGELEEPKGRFSIATALIGDIGPFDGRDHAFKIEWLDEERTIWISMDSLDGLKDWKLNLLKAGLKVFEPSDLSYYVAKKEGTPGLDKQETEPLRLQISMNRADSFHESGAEFLKQQRIEDIIFTELGTEAQQWEFYKVKNRVRLSTLRSQFDLHNPKSKIRVYVNLMTPLLLLVALVAGLLLMKLNVWLTCVLLLVPGGFLGRSFFRRRKALARSPYLFLRGQFLFRRSLKAVMDFAMNLKNLNNWNQEFQSVTIKSANKFEAQLSRHPQAFGTIHGEIKFSKNAFMITCRNLENTYNVTNFFVMEEQPDLPDHCLMTCTVKIRAVHEFIGPRQILKDFENQFYSLVKLDEAVSGSTLQSRASRIIESIHPDENGTLFIKGKPFLERAPESFEAAVDLVKRMSAEASTEQENMGDASPVFPQEKTPVVDGAVAAEFKKSLFLRYLECFALNRTDAFRRMVYPVAIADRLCLFSRLVDAWTYLPVYLRLAQESDDPVERVKFVFCFALAGLTRLKVPERIPNFPFIGETYQAFLSDGTSVDFEQIDDNRTCFFIQSPNKEIHVHGKLAFRVSFADNYVGVDFLGDVVVELGKGVPVPRVDRAPKNSMAAGGVPSLRKLDSMQWMSETVELLTPTNEVFLIRYPKINVSGLVVADFNISFAGGIYVEYKAKGISAYAEFERLDEPDITRQQLFGKVKSMTDQKILSVIGGLIPSFISFDNFCYWKSDLISAARVVAANRLLPSDGSLREDIYSLNKEREATSRFMRIQVAIRSQLMRLMKLREPRH